MQSEIKWALELLHQGGYVLGNLQSPNIIVEKTGGVKLIDFDWAGALENEVEYPYLISSNILWPKGVEALAPIKVEHDRAMFDKLFVHNKFL